MKYSYLFIVTIFVLIASIGIQDSFAANPEFISEITAVITSSTDNAALSTDNTASSTVTPPPNVINININPTALTSERMNLSIFGNILEITHEQTIFRNSTDYTYVGSTTNSKNNVFVTVFGDQVRAEISLPGQNYILTPTALNHQIGYYPNDLDLTSDVVGIHAASTSGENPDWQNIIATFPLFEYSDDQVNDIIIDVIFLYTDAAVAQKGSSNIRLMANQGIDKTNIAFQESNIPIKLVNVEIDGAGRGYNDVSMSTDLERLIITNDGFMDRGNAVRDKENADIGVLFNKIGTRTTDNCGLAADILGDEVNAFVAVNVMCEQESLIGNVIGHEIGHLFGARHQLSNDPFSIPFEFGHGLETGRQTGYQTMMHSNPCNPDDPNNAGCFWQTRWSDPDEQFFGTQIYTGTVKFEDNAKVMALAAPYIASFRGGVESYSITTPTVIVDSFYDDFETNMDKWFLKSGTQWQTKTPHNPNSGIVKVAGTSNCDIRCSMTMIDRVDLTNMVEPTLSFDRFVDEKIDPDEGLFVYISTDNGLHWIELESFTDNNNKNDNVWNSEKYSLNNYSSNQIKVKFDGISTSTNEFTEIDDLRVFDAAVPIDTTSPIITLNGITPPLNVRVDTYIELGATVSDNDPAYSGTVTVGGDTVNTNIVGSYTVTYTAPADASGNIPITVNRIVIVQDILPPVITQPSNITKEATDVLTPVTLTPPTVTDNSGETIIPTINDPSAYPIGATIVIWTATDSSGNTATITQTITITDTTKPTITVPGPITSTDPNVSLGTATADDIFKPVTITNNKPSSFPLGPTTVTWTMKPYSIGIIRSIKYHEVSQINPIWLTICGHSIFIGFNKFCRGHSL